MVTIFIFLSGWIWTHFLHPTNQSRLHQEKRDPEAWEQPLWWVFITNILKKIINSLFIGSRWILQHSENWCVQTGERVLLSWAHLQDRKLLSEVQTNISQEHTHKGRFSKIYRKMIEFSIGGPKPPNQPP